MPGPRSEPFNGKTQSDRLSGKHARHLRNRKLRADWNLKYMDSSKGGGGKEIPYPVIPART